MNPTDFRLGDDGTLDTVIVCRKCGAEMRYTYDVGDALEACLAAESYDAFVEWAKEDAAESHDCADAKDFEHEVMS